MIVPVHLQIGTTMELVILDVAQSESTCLACTELSPPSHKPGMVAHICNLSIQKV